MKQKLQNRSGITLVELLVVISIMMVLAAVVLPQLKFGNEGHKNRESARIVATYLSAARNKAIETGRPCGVLFERGDELVDTDGDSTPDTALTSVQMVQVQVPPSYAGDTMDARATVTGHVATFVPQATVAITPGDLIQFDHQGPWYPIQTFTPGGLPNTVTDVTFDVPTGVPERPWGGHAFSYQIRRQPVSITGTGQTIRSMTPPQRLLAGTAIDFTASGVGNNFFADTNNAVAIIFDSNGTVQLVTGHAGMTTPIEPIYLLVGQELQVPDGTHAAAGPNIDWWSDPSVEENERLPNWLNPETRWIVINPNTGIATVAENMPYETVIANTKNAMRDAIPEARVIAKEGLDGGDRR